MVKFCSLLPSLDPEELAKRQAQTYQPPTRAFFLPSILNLVESSVWQNRKTSATRITCGLRTLDSDSHTREDHETVVTRKRNFPQEKLYLLAPTSISLKKLSLHAGPESSNKNVHISNLKAFKLGWLTDSTLVPDGIRLYNVYQLQQDCSFACKDKIELSPPKMNSPLKACL